MLVASRCGEHRCSDAGYTKAKSEKNAEMAPKRREPVLA